MPDRAAADALRARANTPECATPEDALAGAILAAREEPDSSRLYDASFGHYAAADAGWYWEMKFLRQVGMTSDAGQGDTFEQRVRRLIAKWKEDVAMHAERAGSNDSRQRLT